MAITLADVSDIKILIISLPIVPHEPVIKTVKLAPLNIKNGHYPNLQRFPDARETL